jgi:glycosyltransferase involved in cell wall biosynthesis
MNGQFAPLKTLHLTNSWHATSGGIATFYRALIVEANKRGHQIRLVVPGKNARTEEIGGSARIYYVRAPQARLNPDYRVIYPPRFLAPGSPVQEILAAERPDLVEICDKYTLNYLGALLRRRLLPALDFRPVVVGLSCERMDDNFRAYIGRAPLSRALCAAYLKWIYFPFFDHHIANSEYTAEELLAASRGQMVSRNVWIRPMGVDLQHFSPSRSSPEARSQLRRRLEANESAVVLVYAGRLVPEKNLPLLFEVFRRLSRDAKRDYRLVVAGDGIARPRWEAFCSSHAPGKAFFLGHIKSPGELAHLLANSDAFIHPNDREPFGIAPLEAMASGLPLVAPDRGGVTSYADSNTAWVAESNTEHFVAAIQELLLDHGERARRASNALRRAAEFSWEKRAASFLDLYAELHKAALNDSTVLPASAVSSTPARGFRLALARGVSQTAEKTFRLASKLLYSSRKVRSADEQAEG